MFQIILKNNFEFILLLRGKSLLIRLFSLKNDLSRRKLTKITTSCRTDSVLNFSFCVSFSNLAIIFIFKLCNRRWKLFFFLLIFFLIIRCLCHRIKINLIQIIWYLVISYFINSLRRSKSFQFLINLFLLNFLLKFSQQIRIIKNPTNYLTLHLQTFPPNLFQRITKNLTLQSTPLHRHILSIFLSKRINLPSTRLYFLNIKLADRRPQLIKNNFVFLKGIMQLCKLTRYICIPCAHWDILFICRGFSLNWHEIIDIYYVYYIVEKLIFFYLHFIAIFWTLFVKWSLEAVGYVTTFCVEIIWSPYCFFLLFFKLSF